MTAHPAIWSVHFQMPDNVAQACYEGRRRIAVAFNPMRNQLLRLRRALVHPSHLDVFPK
jgi:hypothetical protein